MEQTEEIDYHLELAQLRLFANLCLKNGQLQSRDREELFMCMKSACINEGAVPFIALGIVGEDDPYYRNYIQRELELAPEFIPDFFSRDGNFYDLDSFCNITLRNTGFPFFPTLFLLKLLQLQANRLSIQSFLEFQLADNFYCVKEKFAGFLWQMLENDGICRLFPENRAIVTGWLEMNDPDGLGKHLYNYVNEQLVEEEESEATIDQQATEMASTEIKGSLDTEQIRIFFSFFYEEKSCNKKPFLPKEAVDRILENGLSIPAVPLQEKYRLNCDLRFPKKIIDFAIHTLFVNHSKSRRDKGHYLRFFGSYIEDYSSAVESPEKLAILTSNIRGERCPRMKFNLEKYLP